MAEYRDRSAAFQATGCDLLALSVDDPARAEPVHRDLGLPFSLLCDPRREVVTAWGLLNAEEKGGIAYPATFVIGPARLVRFRSLDRTASRVDPGPMLDFLRAPKGTAAPQEPQRSSIAPGLSGWTQALGNALRRGLHTPRG